MHLFPNLSFCIPDNDHDLLFCSQCEQRSANSVNSSCRINADRVLDICNDLTRIVVYCVTCVEESRSRRLIQSYLYQLWSAVIASGNTARLPVTSSYQLAPLPPLDGVQVSVTSQQGSKYNPFINSPPLTADVDTNRLATYSVP